VPQCPRFPTAIFGALLAACAGTEGGSGSGAHQGHGNNVADAGPARDAATGFSTADPAKKGPFTVTEFDGVGDDGTFTMYRPADLTDGGPFPVITWGNGTGSTPEVYAFLLNHLASHGFIVIASNSMNVAQGSPPPMVVGVDWVFARSRAHPVRRRGHDRGV
jgi:hypothetical protein